MNQPELRLVLSIISDATKCPVGGRFRRANPMPMESIAAERGGYFFDPNNPEDVALAKRCLEEFNAYLKPKAKKK